MNKVNSILKEVLKDVNPPENSMIEIKKSLSNFLSIINQEIKKSKISAEVFVGGSFAKNTMIKSNEYDIDVFIRFDKKHDDISNLTEKLLKKFKKTRIHGSRDYFKIQTHKNFYIEVVPVRKIKNPKEAENITDLSYSHVNYVKRKLKSKKIIQEILLAKAFCYSNNSYGAESYIRGFSGYGLELIVYYYGSFLKFIKSVSKAKDKIVIDIEKDFKNKQEVLMNVNSAKLKSPIVLIDPTFKQRNVLAALSDDTFNKFKKSCASFLKNPSKNYFTKSKVDFNSLISKAKKSKLDYALIEIKTNKQGGDIAGSKLLKFYNHLSDELKNYFDIKARAFEYDNGKAANIFFSVTGKKEIVFTGPSLKDKKNVIKFKKVHKKTYTKNSRIYSKTKANFKIRNFMKTWKNRNIGKMKDMSIVELKF